MSEPAAPIAPVLAVPPSGNPDWKGMTVYLDQMRSKQVRMLEGRRRAAFWVLGLICFFLAGSILIGEPEPAIAKASVWLQQILSRHGWPSEINILIRLIVPAALAMVLLQLFALYLVWWERKVSAHMQGRLGPMEVGGWHGWAETIADGIKLFLKGHIEPIGVDKWVFRLAPIIVFIPAYVSMAPLFFGEGVSGFHLDIGLVYVLAVSGLSTIGILMAGWGSANKFSILGGLRAAAQIVSFEIPRVLSIIPVVMWTGATSLLTIGSAQSGYLWNVVPRWFIFYPIVGQIAFAIYLITTVAETNRVPFDIPEAESELVAGFHTEYGGMKFAIFFLSEYAYVFVGSVLGTILFLGAGAAPSPFLSIVPSWAWFLP